eukprot:TRINITY_DN2082_c0_g1_i3.p1 TRINITY_DN2082_c0_g1~~TRINITY_DN2082_c0_g1_i3.p1  ORF type:complete len:107 (+),score=15.94 TRINITY_DN2082_c0_g1_i3:68-388(+)
MFLNFPRKSSKMAIQKGDQQHHETLNVIVQFLEVAFHSILFCRKVYPPEIFERRRFMSVPVQMSVSTQLNDYIIDSLGILKLGFFLISKHSVYSFNIFSLFRCRSS